MSHESCTNLHTYNARRDLLEIEFVSNDGVIAGKGLSQRVSKSSTEGKRRTDNRKQDRGYRDTTRNYSAGLDDENY